MSLGNDAVSSRILYLKRNVFFGGLPFGDLLLGGVGFGSLFLGGLLLGARRDFCL